MTKSTVIMVIDGLDPGYLEQCDTPNLRELSGKGFMTLGRAMMPTVTNVNNVSLLTASYPESHGITSNYRLDRTDGREVYMESADYILSETLFQRARRMGATSLLVTAKDKLRTLLGRDANLALSAEEPLDWVVEAIGEPPDIYSLEVNGWVIRAARFILSRRPADLVYIATTDYAMHTYPPESAESQQHMTILDEAIGELVAALPEAQVLITADHGMSSKTRMIDLEAALAKHGIKARAVPVIKDRYVVHHSNLGGSIFVYLDDGSLDEALDILRGIAGVDDALSGDEAAVRFRLHRQHIGDIMVLGAQDVVFGDSTKVTMPANLRSHGSLYEERVPIIGYGGNFEGFDFQENRDLGRFVLERVLK